MGIETALYCETKMVISCHGSHMRRIQPASWALAPNEVDVEANRVNDGVMISTDTSSGGSTRSRSAEYYGRSFSTAIKLILSGAIEKSVQNHEEIMWLNFSGTVFGGEEEWFSNQVPVCT